MAEVYLQALLQLVSASVQLPIKYSFHSEKFEGPWFTTQLTISATIGVVSFLLFSYCRTRWPLLFAPRTKLKGCTFDFNAARLLTSRRLLPPRGTCPPGFLWMDHADNQDVRVHGIADCRIGCGSGAWCSFYYWPQLTFPATALKLLQNVLLPVLCLFHIRHNHLDAHKLECKIGLSSDFFILTRFQHNKDIYDDDDDWPGDEDSEDWIFSRLTSFADPPGNHTAPPDWLDLISDANSYLSVHLMFTYLFTILALYFIYKNYRRFIRSRQLFSLELVHSIPARTVLVTNLPHHLQGERTLAEYFENMGMAVESVTVCREVGSLKTILDRRTKALLDLEQAWVSYVGNPSTVEEYDPDGNGSLLIDTDVEGGQTSRTKLVVPHRHRPTIRPRWFQPKVDALEYLEQQFKEADEQVKKKRRTGKFKSTGAAFVTFEKMSSAQTAVQVAHAPNPNQILTYPAPEPRDIVWSNMAPSNRTIQFRDIFVLATMALLLLFWFFPITALASLLSYKEIKKAMPWLGRLIDSNEQVRAIVQNSLPSVAMITLNALLPFILEGTFVLFSS